MLHRSALCAAALVLLASPSAADTLAQMLGPLHDSVVGPFGYLPEVRFVNPPPEGDRVLGIVGEGLTPPPWTFDSAFPFSFSITHFRSSFDVLRIGNALTPARVPGTTVSLGAAGFHGMAGVCRAVGC